jgi:hypothetical protein
MGAEEPAPSALSPAGSGPTPSVADVEAIGALPHPVPRNLRITQAYHALSAAVAARLGPGANWCTFATWASRQAGQSIRGDDLGAKIDDAFVHAASVQTLVARIRDLRRAVGRAVDADEVLDALRSAWAPLLAVGRVADAVARGNKKVFDEIGAEFARFAALLGAGEDAAGAERFFARFRPGPPPDGQDLLVAAFRDYRRALSTPDAKLRAERMFLANVRVGLHEQTRLEPEITDALDAPVPDPAAIGRRLLEALFTRRGLIARPRSHDALLQVTGRALEPLRAVVRRVITEELMTLTLPGGRVLRLGTDLTGTYARDLATLDDPEVGAFVRTVDPTPDSLAGSGAEDWASLTDRMRMIVDLFRQEHENAELFAPPFTPEQTRLIAAGGTPEGRL